MDKSEAPCGGKGKEDRVYLSAKNKAYRMLTYRDRSSHEIMAKLIEKEFPEDVIAVVISDLKALGVLNDKRFAEQWIRYQVENRNLGPFRLQCELRKKGFSVPEVNRLLEELSEDWEQMARRALLKRYKALIQLQDLRLRRQAFSFLQRKGFDAETILTVFRNSDCAG
ncbi:MAG: regulatory protein RecX [Nitrospiria bacterium]